MVEYATRNLAEASYLQAKGIKIIGKRKEGDKALILFPDEKETRSLVMDYYNGGSVEAKLLFDNFRTIKDFIYMSEEK